MAARRTVLLTGPTGFLGRHILARLLSNKRTTVHAVSRQSGVEQDRLHWHRADLLDPTVPAALVAAIRPTHLLHNAWIATPGRFWTDPENINWMHATARLLKAFAEDGGRRFVGVGSCAEYDWTFAHFVEDATPTKPSTLYGQAKAAAAAIALAHARADDFSAAWGRVFLPYGAGDSAGRLIPTLVRELTAGRAMKLGDGNLLRDFIAAPDVADLLVRLLGLGTSGVFNIGSGRATSIEDAAGYIADRLGRPDLLHFGTRPTPVEEPRSLVADMGKVERILGWSAPTTLQAGLDVALGNILEAGQPRDPR